MKSNDRFELRLPAVNSLIAGALGALAVALGGLGTVTPLVLVGALGLGYSGNAQALTCGTPDVNGLCLSGTATQYGGGFSPQAGESGGFGGASNCVPTRTPVVFLHGNADNALSWAGPPRAVNGFTTPPSSVYQELKNAGYKDCELFGVTYLSASERGNPTGNFHQPAKYDIINRFISKVLQHTGASKVDIVAHSMGVTMGGAALTFSGSWGKVRRFVSIAGAVRGLESCLNLAAVPTCAPQGLAIFFGDPNSFGFYPGNNIFGVLNQWTDTFNSGSGRSLPNMAINQGSVAFYTIGAGTKDQIVCGNGATTVPLSVCQNSSRLLSNSGTTNLKVHFNVGVGVDRDGDKGGSTAGGVGHMKARSNTGKIVMKMLTTTCTTGCASTYAGLHGPAVAQ
jgi:pimeloyl-ACP methyl ester carboxylesterase